MIIIQNKAPRAVTSHPKHSAKPSTSLLARFALRRHETVRLCAWHREHGDLYVFVNVDDLQRQAARIAAMLEDDFALGIGLRKKALANAAEQAPEADTHDVSGIVANNDLSTEESGTGSGDESGSGEESVSEESRAPPGLPGTRVRRAQRLPPNKKRKQANRTKITVDLKHLVRTRRDTGNDDDSEHDSPGDHDLEDFGVAENLSFRVLARTNNAKTMISVHANDSIVISMPINPGRTERCVYNVVSSQNIVEGLSMNGVVHRAILLLTADSVAVLER